MPEPPADAAAGGRCLRRHLRARSPLAGPLILLTILGCWLALLVCGWALVLWPHVPASTSPSRRGAEGRTLVDAPLSVARHALDDRLRRRRRPAADRAAAPRRRSRRCSGFGLLTAAISWLLSVYPALSRRRRSPMRSGCCARRSAPTVSSCNARGVGGAALRRAALAARRRRARPRDAAALVLLRRARRALQPPDVLPWLLALAERRATACRAHRSSTDAVRRDRRLRAHDRAALRSAGDADDRRAARAYAATTGVAGNYGAGGGAATE